MKVNVKLYGTLIKAFPDYNHALGVDLDLPEGATVADLLALLGSPPGAVAAAEGRILKEGETLASGARLRVMQAMPGG